MAEFDSSAAVFNASVEQLAKMMNLMESTPDEWTEQDLPALLCHELSSPLEFGTEKKRDVAGPKIGNRTRSGVPTTPIKSYRELFTHPGPPLALLKCAKDHFKEQAGSANNRSPTQRVGYLCYLLSIASAQVRLGIRLTNLGDSELLRAIEWALNLSFLETHHRALFSKVHEDLLAKLTSRV